MWQKIYTEQPERIVGQFILENELQQWEDGEQLNNIRIIIGKSDLLLLANNCKTCRNFANQNNIRHKNNCTVYQTFHFDPVFIPVIYSAEIFRSAYKISPKECSKLCILYLKKETFIYTMKGNSKIEKYFYSIFFNQIQV